MEFIDKIFLGTFFITNSLLVISGVVSFGVNHRRYILLKHKVNSGEINSSDKLRERLNSVFWVYSVVLDADISTEIKKKTLNNKELKKYYDRYKYYLYIQIGSLALGLIIFVLYIASKISIEWNT